MYYTIRLKHVNGKAISLILIDFLHYVHGERAISVDHDISSIMRKPAFCICQNKTQISFAVTGKLISAFVFATWIISLFFLNPKFKPLAIFCGCTEFVSDLVGNPEDRFSCDKAQS